MSELARVGGPLACLGLAVLLVARTRRDRIAGLAVVAIGSGLLAGAFAPGLTGGRAAGAVAALAVAAALAVLFRHVPWVLPLAALATTPIRLGALGHQLLVPLYVVILGAALLLAWDLVRGDARSRELGAVAWPLALYLAWTGLSLAWSIDLHEGMTELLAFYIPFTLLAVAVARLPWSDLGLNLLYAELGVMALVFASVGFYQYETRNIFQNPRVITENAYAPFFRVNSVFWDPSVYGRFLVVAIVPSAVLIVRGRSLRLALGAFAAMAATWLGLLISFSQSSFAALIVAVVGLAIVAWRWRSVLAIVVAASLMGGLLVAEPQVRRSLVHHTSSGLNSATRGRASLVSNGIRIFAAHPVVGVGVGGFKRAYAERRHIHGKHPIRVASHDAPVTVAAETGIVGLVLGTWLVLSVLIAALRRIDRGFLGRASLSFGLALAAILCHSLFYNDFFEDPMTWTLFGLVALTASTVRDEVPA